jgi:hypothetical protein
MGTCCDDGPPLASFDSTIGHEPDLSGEDTVSDEDYLDACLASSDLRELGLTVVSPWAGAQVHRAHARLFRDYRAARSAVDFGRPQSAIRLQEASSRLREEATKVIANFPGQDGHRRTEVAA